MARIAAAAVSTSYGVDSSSTPGPSNAQRASPAALVGHPDASRVDEPPAVGKHAVVGHVDVTRNDDVGVGVAEEGGRVADGRRPGQDRRVGVGCRMAEEHLAEPVDHLALRRRPGGDALQLGHGEPLPAPGGDVGAGGPLASPGTAVSRSAFPRRNLAGVPERLEQPQRLARERAGDDVPTNDDDVGLGEPWVGEHRLQRRQVAVDVVERGDPHVTRRSRARPR